jgi:hypothetical protein
MKFDFDTGALLGNAVRRVVRWCLRGVSHAAMYAGLLLLCVPMSTSLSAWPLTTTKIVDTLHGTPVVIALGFALLLPGIWLRSLNIRRVQADNDREARHIMDALRADPQAEVKKFYLYLRAFESTGRLRVPLFLRLRKFSLGLFQTLTNDTESYVSSAVRRIAPLIAMGLPGEAVGAGRVLAEEARWTAEILLLMRRAQAIFLVPSSRPGTLWEMKTLKDEGLLGRVIFIMPPRARGQADILERWESAREALGTLGIEAPEHQPDGLMFEVGPDLKVSNVEPLLLNSVRQVRKSLKRIMSDDPPKGGLFKVIAAADRRARRAAFWGWCETARQLSPYAVAVLAVVLDAPNIGYDASESWSTVVDRDLSAEAASRYAMSEVFALQGSARYRAVEARTSAEQVEAVKQALLLRGLPRLDDKALRAYYVALATMLQRVNVQTCAAITRGTIEPAAMSTAMTYIPSEHVLGFQSARVAAIVAAAEGTPSPPLDPEAAEAASERFKSLLGAEGWQHYERIAEATGERSDEDLCWLSRAMLGSVARLPDTEAAVFARILASSAAARGEEGEVAMQARR